MNLADPSRPVARLLRALAARERPGERLTEEAFAAVMRGEASTGEVAGILTGLRAIGESADEVTGAVRALRGAMVEVPVHDRTHLVDTCGTGGGAVGTFNISTAAALVAVGAGAVVAKHGNRSYTSRCGSADVLEALGVRITVDAPGAAQLLSRAGMAFLFAPAFHPAMRHVAPVRRELGIPTVMNIVGPLANPAGVRRQLVGVADPDQAPVVAEVLRRLGVEHALVVHGEIGMDEIAPAGTNRIWEIRDGSLERWVLDPEHHALTAEVKVLAGGDPGDNAARLERLVDDPARDPAGRATVVLNAGAALYVAGLADGLEAGFELAAAALDGGAAARALDTLRREAPVSTSE